METFSRKKMLKPLNELNHKVPNSEFVMRIDSADALLEKTASEQ